MKPDISEFSYGYALTDELINWHGTSLTAAPVFPSLYQEGQSGGGYDLMLQRPGLPLFLQFKLSHCMVRRTAQEVKDGIFQPPFYRMHMRPARHSDQHEMLLDLENAGNEVYYSAPAFHTSDEFNAAYLSHQVRSRSLWIRPSHIGPLPDDDEHHVAFLLGSTPHICSKPRPLDTSGKLEEFERSVAHSFKEKSRTAIKRDALENTAHYLSEIAEKHRHISPESKRSSRVQLAERHPLDRIAFYSQVFLDSQLFIVRETDNGQVPVEQH
ncbi:MAG: hypothetical protein NTW21_16865 [Verrucomicrobia bacterium]|nr:hypothetical protein [Verrucomicrobiota bacterium]